ncbi:unnamed protein product, partial [Discosporangium mesarthrocarpum]
RRWKARLKAKRKEEEQRLAVEIAQREAIEKMNRQKTIDQLKKNQ